MGWLILVLFLVVTALPAVIAAVSSALRRILTARRPPPTVNPFDALHLQARLGALADEILRLESDPGVYARAFRIKATRTAYDDLLVEACHLAGIDAVAVPAPANETSRMSAELELAARGWSW